MRDVTPVEALDTKLAVLASVEWMRRMAPRPGLSFDPETVKQQDYARQVSFMVRKATPVCWTERMFDAVQVAAKSYPPEAWPTIPPGDHFRLHVCPKAVASLHDPDGPDEEGQSVAKVVLTGMATLDDGPWAFVYGLHRVDGFWTSLFQIQVPAHTPLEQIQKGEREVGHQLDDQFSRSMVAWAFATWAFLDQRVAVEERVSVDRQARKRATRLDIDPIVHIVRLRKTDSHAHDSSADPHDVEWSCQWFVRGHWRNQWHPRMQRHAPVWILPHIKGPADMPLKTPAPEVWQVAR